MTSYSVYSKDAEQITSGLQGPEVCDEAHQVAQRIANERGEPVWLGPNGAKWKDLEEIKPEDEAE